MFSSAFTFSVHGAATEADTATITSVSQSQQTAHIVTLGSRSPVDVNSVTVYTQTTAANSTTCPGLKRSVEDAFSPTSAMSSTTVLSATSTSPSAMTTGVAQLPPLRHPTGLVDTSIVVGMTGEFVRWFGHDGK